MIKYWKWITKLLYGTWNVGDLAQTRCGFGFDQKVRKIKLNA